MSTAQPAVSARASASLASCVACKKFVDPKFVLSVAIEGQTIDLPSSWAVLCRLAEPEASDEDVARGWKDLPEAKRLEYWHSSVSHLEWAAWQRSLASTRSIRTLELFKRDTKLLSPPVQALVDAIAGDDELFGATDEYLTNGTITSRPELKEVLQALERTAGDDTPLVDLLKSFDADDHDRGVQSSLHFLGRHQLAHAVLPTRCFLLSTRLVFLHARLYCTSPRRNHIASTCSSSITPVPLCNVSDSLSRGLSIAENTSDHRFKHNLADRPALVQLPVGLSALSG
jgi:hypothetical protein